MKRTTTRLAALALLGSLQLLTASAAEPQPGAAPNAKRSATATAHHPANPQPSLPQRVFGTLKQHFVLEPGSGTEPQEPQASAEGLDRTPNAIFGFRW